jgi:hypothetical protein
MFIVPLELNSIFFLRQRNIQKENSKSKQKVWDEFA